MRLQDDPQWKKGVAAADEITATAEPPHESRLQLDSTDSVGDYERKSAEQGLTLATLCDLVLGEDACERSDAALVRAVSQLVRAKSPTVEGEVRL